MKRKTVDKLIIYGCLTIFLLLTLIIGGYLEIWLKLKPDMSKINKSALEVHFVDVGEGDATLIRFSSGKTMLIDSGDNVKVKQLTTYIDKVFFNSHKKVFDYVVLTHSDSDHSGNMDTILDKYKVNNFIRPNILIDGLENYLADGRVKYDNNNDYVSTITRLYSLEKDNKIKVSFAEPDTYIDMGNNAKVHILSPLKPYYTTTNDYSIVMIVEDNNEKFMLTSDASTDVENDIINSYDEDVLDVDVLKLGHHGSDTSTSLDWLDTTQPDYAVISAGEDNSYQHPSSAVLDNIELYNEEHTDKIKIAQTSILGNIVYYSNSANQLGMFSIDNIGDYLFLSWWVVVIVLIVVIGVAMFINDFINLFNRNKATNVRSFK